MRAELTAFRLPREDSEGGGRMRGEGGPPRRRMGPPPGEFGGGFGGGFGDDEEGARPAMRPGGRALMPRMVLRVTVTNRSEQPMDIAVTDVVSALGNFAVRPERLSLAPGEEATLDPFLSPFPDNFAELVVELRLRRGTERETQTVRLGPVDGP